MPSMLEGFLSVRAMAMGLPLKFAPFDFVSSNSNRFSLQKLEKWNRRGNLS